MNPEAQATQYSKEFLKKARKYCFAIAIFMALGWWITTYTQLLEVTSESLEGIHYVLVRKSDSIRRGDIVSIQGYRPLYVGDHIFTKRVIGLPGDQIVRNKNQLTVKAKNNSFLITLPLLKKTKEGDPLTSLSHNVIPEGYFFVMGDHPRSFDSRYEEFGLVSVEKIWGKAIWVW